MVQTLETDLKLLEKEVLDNGKKSYISLFGGVATLASSILPLLPASLILFCASAYFYRRMSKADDQRKQVAELLYKQ